MKMPRVQKTKYQSSACLPYIGPASHKIERILKEVGVSSRAEIVERKVSSRTESK